MGQAAKAREQDRQARGRLRVLRHYEQVTRNVSQTCRSLGFHGASSTSGVTGTAKTAWSACATALEGRATTPLRRPYRHRRPDPAGPPATSVRAPPISLFLQRYHQVYVSPPTIQRILKRHRVPRVSLKRYRPGPRRRREIHVPGQSVQVDVKHLKLGGRRFYQFTAIDEATRYRVLRVYAHNSIKSATEFIEEVRRRLPMAIQRIQTDHASEFGTDFTWHLRDLGVIHRQSPRGYPQANGKVERSHRTDEDEFYRRVIFRTPAELAQKLRQWEHEYNHRRLHLALGGRTPAERLCELRIAPEPVQPLA